MSVGIFVYKIFQEKDIVTNNRLVGDRLVSDTDNHSDTRDSVVKEDLKDFRTLVLITKRRSNSCESLRKRTDTYIYTYL